MNRIAEIERQTGETQISLRLNLDGTGEHRVNTGIGFFDHMLTLVAVHGLFDLEVRCQGDLHVDSHHTVEDVGIALGQACHQALGNRERLRRIGVSYVPLDESLARVVIDLSGRGFLRLQAELSHVQAGQFPGELVEDFFQAFAINSKSTIHAELLAGRNGHHQIEVLFKALARALRAAAEVDPRQSGIPSSKGILV